VYAQKQKKDIVVHIERRKDMAVDIISTAFAILVVFIIVAAPIAFFRKFISRKTRTVGSRPFVSGRDCRTARDGGRSTGSLAPLAAGAGPGEGEVPLGCE
jgi:hypothetical protein